MTTSEQISITSHTAGNDWINENWVTVADFTKMIEKTEVHELPEFTAQTRKHFESNGDQVIEVSQIPNGRFNRKVRIVVKTSIPTIHECRNMREAKILKKKLEKALS